MSIFSNDKISGTHTMFVKSVLHTLLHLSIVLILTLLTQIGGVIWLISISVEKIVFRGQQARWTKQLARFGVFLIIYLIFTFGVVPLLAPVFGRVPLPVFHSKIKPLTPITVLLNRHYVRKSLKSIVVETAETMDKKFSGTITHYLDAGFPFFNGFPLLPHLSHNDGKKMDLSFFYEETATLRPVQTAPSPIGYGICEEPVGGEEAMSAYCAQRGFWQYSILQKMVPQGNATLFRLDMQRTRAILVLLATHPKISKVFIEPHLKKRLRLDAYSRIRFQGCQAVRHDDHIHIQL